MMTTAADRGTVSELCCGAGGMGLGFDKHYEIIHACDIEEFAVRTYGSNHPDTRTRRQDIRLLTGCRGDFDGLTGVIGGPPCQGSSEANTKRKPDLIGAVTLEGDPIPEDPRNALMREFMRLVDEIQPHFFVMENVPKVSDERKTSVVKAGIKAGYNVVSKLLLASDYGAAQTRKRWIVVGIRNGRWILPAHRPARTVRQAFAGITDQWGFMRSRPDTLERLSLATEGKWGPMDDDRNYDGMTRLLWDQPSKAITNLKKTYMRHPDENRNISLAEAAALQGFPPGYIWHGTDSQRAQMIANAMPSELAEAIAGSIAAPGRAGTAGEQQQDGAVTA